jgi:hypothetical protein
VSHCHWSYDVPGILHIQAKADRSNVALPPARFYYRYRVPAPYMASVEKAIRAMGKWAEYGECRDALGPSSARTPYSDMSVDHKIVPEWRMVAGDPAATWHETSSDGHHPDAASAKGPDRQRRAWSIGHVDPR